MNRYSRMLENRNETLRATIGVLRDGPVRDACIEYLKEVNLQEQYNKKYDNVIVFPKNAIDFYKGVDK